MALGAVARQGEVKIEALLVQQAAGRQEDVVTLLGHQAAQGQEPEGRLPGPLRGGLRGQGDAVVNIDDLGRLQGSQVRQIALIGAGIGAHQAGRGQLLQQGPVRGVQVPGPGAEAEGDAAESCEATQAAVAGPSAQGAWIWPDAVGLKPPGQMHPRQRGPKGLPGGLQAAPAAAAAPAAEIARLRDPSPGSRRSQVFE